MGEIRPSGAANERTMEQGAMSHFSINLAGMTLPDAIAAVVEAWYDCQVLTEYRQDINIAITDKDGAIDDSIAIINELYNFKQMKIKLERRGGKIGIRGLLPSKTVENGFAVQRISLGQPLTAAGLRASKLLAELVIDQLKDGLFDWQKWNDRKFVFSTASNLLETYDQEMAVSI